MDCPSCHQSLPDEAAFCGHCGESLAAERVCAGCGRSNSPRMRFCLGCGQPLGGAAEVAPPTRDPRDYTPKHLADKILQSRSALEGEHKQVTVLFVDVQRNTELSRQVGSEVWHKILDGFFQVLADGVHRFEGTINQYTGDGIMALFGAPIAHEDHAQRACYTALSLRDQLHAYSEKLAGDHGIDFQVRTGLNSGEVVVGKIGDDLRMDYTAQGEIVNLAARMEALAGAGDAYLAENTARLVEGYFDLDEIGPRDVQGASEPIRVYALKGPGRLRTRLERAQARGLTAFVGRERESGALEGALEQALAGNGQIVGVVGEPGIGKSRLCLEFVLRCHGRGLRVLEAHCPQHGKTQPFGTIQQLLRAAFGLREDERDAAARARVATGLTALDPALEENIPLLLDFLGMPDPEHPAPELDASARERKLLRLAGQLIHAGSAQAPTVLLVDDTHWIDEPSDVFLARIAAAVSGTRTLLLVNFRPEYSAEWMGGSDYQQLPLRALGPEDAEALLRALVGEDAAHTALRERIRLETGGNPFFLEEVVQSLAESGTLKGQRGAYRVTAPLDAIEIPQSVQAVVAARIDRLDEREKHVLQTASVIGKEVPEVLLSRVAELPETDLAAALERLRRGEFLHEAALFPDVVHEFKHEFTREVAYAMQLADRRERTHCAVASVMEAVYGDRIDPHAKRVAQHWREAGRPLDAAEWYLRASVYLAPQNLTQSIQCENEVLPLVDKDLDSYGPLGHPERTRARRLLVKACTEKVGSALLLALPPEEVKALFERAKRLIEFGHAEGAERDEEYAVAKSRLYGYYGMANFMYGRVEEGLRYARLALTFAEESGDEREKLKCLRDLVQLLTYGTRYQEAYDLVSNQTAHPRPSPLALGPDGVALFADMVGHGADSAVDLGRPREALEMLESVLGQMHPDRSGVPIHELVSTEPFVPYLWFVWCKSAELLGYGTGIVEVADKLRQQCEARETPRWIPWCHYWLAVGQELRGDWKAAAASAQRMEDLILTGDATIFFAAAKVAQTHAHLGDRALAREFADKALSNLSGVIGIQRAGVFLYSAEALLWSFGSEAREEVTELLDRLEQEGVAKVYPPRVHALRAELALLCGDERTCERERAKAQRLGAEMGAHGLIERMARNLEELRAAS